MTEHEASRTLVKSPPELWAELSDESSLGRHFDPFGEIRITRLEPETAVAWEGECVSGTVRLEPSGWGTKVILTARAQAVPDVEAPADDEPVEAAVEAEAELEVVAEPEPEPAAAVSAVSPAKRGFFGRLFGFRARPRPVPPEAVAVAPPVAVAPAHPEHAESEPEPAARSRIDAAGVLAAALDSLGQAHHRPFSRG